MRMRAVRLEVVAALFVIAADLHSPAQTQRIVIAASTVLDGRGAVLHDTRIVIEGSKIAAIDRSAGRVDPVDYDLRGLTVMPGWIDTHIHLNWHLDANGKSVTTGEKPEDAALYTAGDAWLTLLGGFTTVQSVGASIDAVVRDRVNGGVIPGPRILTSLRQIQGRSGNPDELRALVHRTKEEGGDVIKLFATTGLGAGGDQSMTDRKSGV